MSHLLNSAHCNTGGQVALNTSTNQYADEPIINIDVGNINDAVFNNVAGLVDTKFSEKTIGFNPADMFKKLTDDRKPPYDLSAGCWKEWPSDSAQGFHELIAERFNKTGVMIDRVMSLEHPRSRLHNTNVWAVIPLNKDELPDAHRQLALTSCSHKAKLEARDWSQVYSFVQLGSQIDVASRKEAVYRMALFTKRIFHEQPDRHFVLCAALLSSCMFIVMFNRSGAFISKSFDIHEDPTRFVQVIGGIYMMDWSHMGYDNAVKVTQCDRHVGPTYYHFGSGLEYRIQGVLHQDNSITGPGAVYLTAERNGAAYLVKLSWELFSDVKSELEALGAVRGIKGVVQLEMFGFIDNKDQCCTLIDFEKQYLVDGQYSDIFERVNRRYLVHMVVTPRGTSLQTFYSMCELLSGLIDIVDAIEAIHDRGYVHSNISPHNILFSNGRVGRVRRAFLIGFGKAGKTGSHHENDGDVPFMSLDRLLTDPSKPTPERHYYHDLESLLYVLIYTCCTSLGTANPPSEDASRFYHEQWSGFHPGCSKGRFAQYKRIVFTYEANFTSIVLPVFHPFATMLKHCVCKLRRLMFPLRTTSSIWDSTSDPLMTQLPLERRRPKDFFAVYRGILQEARRKFRVT